LALCALASSCASPYAGVPAAPSRPDLKLDIRRITAPFDRHGTQELAILAQDRGFAPARLRRAHIYTETGQPQRAVAMLNAILHGPPRPSPAVESHALYLRARAYGRLGKRQMALADCRRASALAMDPALRSATLRLLQEHNALAEANRAKTRRVEVRSRAGWDAAPPRTRNMGAMGRIFRITVHHSANLARSPSLREATRAIKLDQRYHMSKRGWGDIGYHYLIDPAGRIWQGRDLRWQGAHAGNHFLNRGNIGVCLLGNFIGGRSGQAPTPPQVASLDALLRHLTRKHHIRQGNIFTHQEMQGIVTVCPGPRLQRVVERLRRNMVAAAPGTHWAAGGSDE
jgi:hypothetical protein